MSLEKLDVADNMDLLLLMQEFEGMYEANYGRRPKITRSQERKATNSLTRDACRCGRINAEGGKRKTGDKNPLGAKNNEQDCPRSHPLQEGSGKEPSNMLVNGFAIHGAKNEQSVVESGKISECSFRLLGPLPNDLPEDLRELAQIVARDMQPRIPAVRWGDVMGLNAAKQIMKEAVVIPMQYPEYFTGILTPWKGVLLYGPPGTGKTLLARAAATECMSTFFNISASTVTSKWRGDSEKLIRVLFRLACHYSPSIVFMDEVDALMVSRGGEGEHEASRRMKTELMMQMDGLSYTAERVVVLAASNRPWELDNALLRRMEKKIYVPLPDVSTRKIILEHLLGDRVSSAQCFEDLASRTENFSGSDLAVLAKEACMEPLRRLIKSMEMNPGSGKSVELEAITQEDLTRAMEVSKPSSKKYESQYELFSEKYGQRGDALRV